jgi:hypothetical protein
MRGTVQQQTIVLENGATTQINHLYVTAIEVIPRSKRTSIMANEKGKGYEIWKQGMIGFITGTEFLGEVG